MPGYVPPHRCRPDCLDPANSSWAELGLEQDLELDSQCHAHPGAGCGMEAVTDPAQAQDCHSFVFDRSVFQETLVTRFNLVCNDEWKKGFIGTWYKHNST